MTSTGPTRHGSPTSLDDLELELRKLPGVKAAGFDEKQIRALKERLNQVERGSSSTSPTLSALLAKTLKSSCCS